MSIKDGFPVPQALLEWVENDDVCPFKTIPGAFKETVRRWGDKPYVGKRVEKKFEFRTYSQVYEDVLNFASQLVELGFVKEDRVANYCNNCIDWPIVDFGASYIGCVHVPMYPTLSQSEMAFIVRQSGARLIIVPDKGHLNYVLNEVENFPILEHIVCLDGVNLENIKLPDRVKIWNLREFLEAGRVALNGNLSEIETRCATLSPDDIFTIVYTSGTTGDPKGAMLMHGNFVSQSVPLSDYVLNIKPGDSQLSFLPLSHVFERVVHYAMVAGGGAVGFSKSIATVTSDMSILKPTFVPSVPRLFEKVFAKVLEQSATGMRHQIFQKAIKAGKRYREAVAKGKVSMLLRAEHAMYDKLVYSKVREKMGGNVRHFISGGAPLRPEVAEFFLNVGLSVLEGYGLTETSPVLAVNRPGRQKVGTVGIAPDNVEVKISDDGEIIARGPNIMLGYFGLPEITRSVIDKDGWFYTGDIGFLDEEGYLTITDRKKEILVLSNGKNVAPQPIELSLNADPLIAQSVLLGNDRGYVAALLVPNFEGLEKWANDKKLQFNSREDLVKNSEVLKLYRGIVNKICEPLSNYEKVRRICVLPREFSASAGEITPTLKIKRRVIEEHFQAEILSLFAGDSE